MSFCDKRNEKWFRFLVLTLIDWSCSFKDCGQEKKEIMFLIYDYMYNLVVYHLQITQTRKYPLISASKNAARIYRCTKGFHLRFSVRWMNRLEVGSKPSFLKWWVASSLRCRAINRQTFIKPIVISKSFSNPLQLLLSIISLERLLQEESRSKGWHHRTNPVETRQ